MHQLLPFLLLGIGFDDIYVLVNGLDNAQKEFPDDVEAQVRHAFTHNGLSITVSSLTNACSFASG